MSDQFRGEALHTLAVEAVEASFIDQRRGWRVAGEEARVGLEEVGDVVSIGCYRTLAACKWG